MKIRIFSILLFLFFCLNAQTPVAPSLGDGSSVNPYQISSLENLYWIATDTARWSANYIQTGNIDASGTRRWFPDGTGEYRGWRPLGFTQYYYFWNSVDNVWQINGMDYRPFSGSYDGNSMKISGLYINRDSSVTEIFGQPTGIDSAQYIGLFGILDGAVIKNMICHDFNVTGTEEVGGLVGNAVSSEIRNCHISGTVTGSSCVGGLVGCNRQSAIEMCSTDIRVEGEQKTGGMIGELWGQNATALECYSLGHVKGTNSTGGFVGRQEYGGIMNCYSRCSVDGGNYTGGFTGYDGYDSYIALCYSTGSVIGSEYTGGFTGYELETGAYSNIFWCFWDTQTSGLVTSSGGTGKTTSELRVRSLYVDNGWDLDTVWSIQPTLNNGYPFLQALGVPEVCHVRFEVDMSTCAMLDPSNDTVRITGSFFDWAVPGTMEEQDMTRDGDGGIWYVEMLMDPGTYQYKYFFNSGWSGNEWEGDPNRVVSVQADTTIHNIWGSPTDELPSRILTGTLPDDFILNPPYPNPFNPIVTLSYFLPADGFVELAAFNILGEKVDTMIKDHRTSGYHSLSWNASRLSGGIYIVKMTSENIVRTQKVILLK